MNDNVLYVVVRTTYENRNLNEGSDHIIGVFTQRTLANDAIADDPERYQADFLVMTFPANERWELPL